MAWDGLIPVGLTGTVSTWAEVWEEVVEACLVGVLRVMTWFLQIQLGGVVLCLVAGFRTGVGSWLTRKVERD